MKETLATAIDFYMETDKISPFVLHINGSSASRQLIELRNNAFILNKLSLLYLQPLSNCSASSSFEDEYCQLYALTLQSLINNPMMPFNDFGVVKDLIQKIEIYYQLLEKLTFTSEGISQQSMQLKKKLNLNSFWPRIRSLMMAAQEKIPTNHAYIREYITIRRGLMESDKKYFVSQMMAKKVQTKQLQLLIKAYDKQQTNGHKQTLEQMLSMQQTHSAQQDKYQDKVNASWSSAKMSARMIALTDQQGDWKTLYNFLTSSKFQNQLPQNQKDDILKYLQDILNPSINSASVIRKNNGSNLKDDNSHATNFHKGLVQHEINWKKAASQVIWKGYPFIQTC